MKKSIPNIISAVRIALAVAIAVLPIFSVSFFAVYAVFIVLDFAGMYLKNSFNAKSDLGNNLDHIASLIFIAVLMIRYFSAIEIPVWAFYIATGIAVIKCASLVFGAVRYKKAPFINTDWNKAAKWDFYLAPLWFWFAGVIFASVVVLAVMLIATVEEFIINVSSKQFDPDVKTIIPFKKLAEKFKKKKK
ncbi:MAG: hypothetical protein E7515_06930 [Ruminococcaceae bacterium]|jgi:CDP-diacylglycerol--glycerol-3-phosphate 3-phosphatidyltransferase|nr:hypothetical protein [Oscillospiraceae bacterium]